MTNIIELKQRLFATNDTHPETVDISELDFSEIGDIESLFNLKNWLIKSLENSGAEIVGCGVGFGGADVSIKLDQARFTVFIKPI